VYLPGPIGKIDWGKMPALVPGPDGLEEVWAFCLALGFSKYLYFELVEPPHPGERFLSPPSPGAGGNRRGAADLLV